MVQHHFVSAWVPANGEERENYAREVSKNLYSVGTLVKLGTIESGKSVTDKAVLYSGPQDQDRLEQIAPGLELVVDYGWLTFLAKPIYWLLSFLYGIVGNWGWAIVLLTCIVKAILYPVSAAGYRSMARMKEVTPRMKQLQDRYKDDKQRLNQAMMELYRTEKINPSAAASRSCCRFPCSSRSTGCFRVPLSFAVLRGSSGSMTLRCLTLVRASCDHGRDYVPADPAQPEAH